MGFVLWRLEAPYALDLILAFLDAPKSPGFVEVVHLLFKGTHGATIEVLDNRVFTFRNLRPRGTLFRQLSSNCQWSVDDCQ